MADTDIFKALHEVLCGDTVPAESPACDADEKGENVQEEAERSREKRGEFKTNLLR